MEQDRLKEKSSEHEMTEESFLKEIYTFMKHRNTPIERIPHLGFKQIDLFLMYKTVQDLGGYQQVTAQQLWKKVYNILGGNPRSTSAATCTRRHYEKLLLSFECHQTGYEDDIVFRTPRTQNRFHSGSYRDFEHESVKRADFRNIPKFPQTSPTTFLEHQRQMFSFPLNITPYFPPSSTSLPNYIPYRDTPLPYPGLQPSQTPAPYLDEASAEVLSCRQPLNRLRYLAKEYTSSAGWEEPLNLSQKENSPDTLSDVPSSFGPPATKKPKFLNKASPLYPPRGLTTEDGADQAEAVEETSQGEVQGFAGAGPSPKSDDVIDLTSSSLANPVPRRASPPSVHLFNRRSSNPEAFAMKRERDPHPYWLKEEPFSMHGPNSALLQQSNPIGPQAPDSNGNMEIQIPLKVLQELIKKGLLSSPALSGHSLVSQEPPKADRSPEPKLLVRSHSETSESSTPSKEPEDLSFKSPQRNLSDTSQQVSSMKRQRSFGSTEELKPQSLFSPVKLSLDWDTTSRASYPKPPHGSAPKNQEPMSPRSPRYSEDAPISLTVKSETKSEKVMAIPPIMTKEISFSPPLLQVTSDHLKFLLATLPYRLERGQTF